MLGHFVILSEGNSSYYNYTIWWFFPFLSASSLKAHSCFIVIYSPLLFNTIFLITGVAVFNQNYQTLNIFDMFLFGMYCMCIIGLHAYIFMLNFGFPFLCMILLYYLVGIWIGSDPFFFLYIGERLSGMVQHCVRRST